MARKKLTVSEEVVEAIFEKEKKPFHVISAQLDDGYCTFNLEHLTGVERGEITIHKKRKLIAHDDLYKAFAKLNVHLAVIDDVFKHAGVEITDIDSLHNHDFTWLYTVTGFKIQGKDENEGVVLIGTKMVSGSGRFILESPKVALDKSSSYLWHNELKAAINHARYEVEQYHGGKGTLEEQDEETKPDPNQTNLFNQKDVERDENESLDEDFANAAV
jgi:hypothetical protein